MNVGGFGSVYILGVLIRSRVLNQIQYMNVSLYISFSFTMPNNDRPLVKGLQTVTGQLATASCIRTRSMFGHIWLDRETKQDQTEVYASFRWFHYYVQEKRLRDTKRVEYLAVIIQEQARL